VFTSNVVSQIAKNIATCIIALRIRGSIEEISIVFETTRSKYLKYVGKYPKMFLKAISL